MIARVALVVLALVALPGCASTHWKEEVELHDGRKIVVDRYQTYGGMAEIGQSAPIKTQEIDFTVPDSRRSYHFKSEYSDDVGRANLFMLALHIKDGVPYLVTEPNLCLAYNKWGRPNPPYVIFKHDGQEWKRIPMAELPAEFKTINLVVSTKNKEEKFRKNGVFRAEQVKANNKQLSQKQYKEILREVFASFDLCPDWSSSRYASPKAPIPIPPQPSERGQ